MAAIEIKGTGNIRAVWENPEHNNKNVHRAVLFQEPTHDGEKWLYVYTLVMQWTGKMKVWSWQVDGTDKEDPVKKAAGHIRSYNRDINAIYPDGMLGY